MLEGESGAIFSDCGNYRYVLWRKLGPGNRVCTFVGLNSSIAGAVDNDPTIRRCIAFAKRWGYDKVVMINLFGLCATDPTVMTSHQNPVGDMNDFWITEVAKVSEQIVFAWGNTGQHMNRNKIVEKMLSSQKLACLGKNKSGSPKHPLYVAGDRKLIDFAS